MSDLKNGNIAINSKTSKEKLMTFSPVMEYKVSLKNTKFQNQSHLGWYFTRENVEFPDQILSPELKRAHSVLHSVLILQTSQENMEKNRSANLF